MELPLEEEEEEEEDEEDLEVLFVTLIVSCIDSVPSKRQSTLCKVPASSSYSMCYPSFPLQTSDFSKPALSFQKSSSSKLSQSKLSHVPSYEDLLVTVVVSV